MRRKMIGPIEVRGTDGQMSFDSGGSYMVSVSEINGEQQTTPRRKSSGTLPWGMNFYPLAGTFLEFRQVWLEPVATMGARQAIRDSDHHSTGRQIKEEPVSPCYSSRALAKLGYMLSQDPSLEWLDACIYALKCLFPILGDEVWQPDAPE